MDSGWVYCGEIGEMSVNGSIGHPPVVVVAVAGTRTHCPHSYVPVHVASPVVDEPHIDLDPDLDQDLDQDLGRVRDEH